MTLSDVWLAVSREGLLACGPEEEVALLDPPVASTGGFDPELELVVPPLFPPVFPPSLLPLSWSSVLGGLSCPLPSLPAPASLPPAGFGSEPPPGKGKLG